MQPKIAYQKLVLIACNILFSLSSQAQEFTLTTSNANISGYRALMSVPALANNPLAIILVTPLGNTANLNPHPIGAYYNEAKWCIMNLDQASMIPGLSFKVQYWLAPGPSQFMHQLSQLNMGAEGSYIDNPALNNKPTTQFKIFQNWAPGIRGGLFNRYETKTGYNAATGRWYITNLNSQPLEPTSAYNVIITTGTSTPPTDSTPVNNTGAQACKCPASLPPNGSAGGDLSGTYPNPRVTGLQGNRVSDTPLNFGDVLQWNGYQWVPGIFIPANTGSVSTAKPSVLHFEQNAFVRMDNASINSESVPGLTNRTFTVAQNSQVVFNAVITVANDAAGLTIWETRPVEVWFVVEILNASNQVIARSVSEIVAYDKTSPTINSSGVGILAAGTYHTRVTLNRPQGGAPLSSFNQSPNRSQRLNQGGQVIISIVPD